MIRLTEVEEFQWEGNIEVLRTLCIPSRWNLFNDIPYPSDGADGGPTMHLHWTPKVPFGKEPIVIHRPFTPEVNRIPGPRDHLTRQGSPISNP